MITRNPLDRIPGMEHPVVQLIISFLFDGIGMFTYVVPGLGEFGDIIWAPTQALFITGMVGWEPYGWMLVVFGFTEEILPLTDVLPSCTIAWIYKAWMNRRSG